MNHNLLRKWIREEIRIAIEQNNSYYREPMSTWTVSSEYADQLYEEVIGELEKRDQF